MATDKSELIMSLLSLLGVGRDVQSKSWQSYGGINAKGPSTLLLQARDQISNIFSSVLGPAFGPLVGGIASDYIVGLDFTRSGGLHNNLSGLLSPSAGTYANAFQRTYQNQTLRMLTTNRLNVEKLLRRDFYKNYYELTMSRKLGESDKAYAARVEAQTKSAMDNLVSVPAALQFFLDPTENRRAVQGIKNTQAGLLYWQSRMDPQVALGLLYNANRDPVQMASAVGLHMKEMVKRANSWMLGKGGGKDNTESYGGFNGASVAELASILQNASNQLDISGMDALKKSLGLFLKKVRLTAKALAPLKDIFGLDIKAMTDMIQAASGQNITQLTPSMVRSIAKNTSDMARYSGATITQIANAGQKLFLQSALLGGTSFSRIGASHLGAFYSGLIAQGNAPAGVHAAEYAGNTQKALASAQASAGVDRAAMAYGLWRERIEELNRGRKLGLKEDTSVEAFMALVQGRRGESSSMMQALVKTVNARGGNITLYGLIKGTTTSGYRLALQSGRLALLGISLQYQNKLATAIMGLRISKMLGVSDLSLRLLGAFMSDLKNAPVIKDLLTNANDPKAITRFILATRDKKFGGRYAAIDERSVNYLLNRGLILQPGTRWATKALMDAFRTSQDTLRKLLAPLDEQGTGAYLSFWRAISNTNDLNKVFALGSKGLVVNNAKGASATISQKAVLMHTRALLGATNLTDAQKRVQNLLQSFGKDRAIEMLSLANGDLAKDLKYISSLKTVAAGMQEGKLKLYNLAKAYTLSRRLKHLSGKVSKLDFEGSTLATAIYHKANLTYTKAMDELKKNIKDSTKRLAKLKLLGEAYYKDIQRAFRVRNILKSSAKDLGLEGNDQSVAEKKKALITALKDKNIDLSALASMSLEEYKKRQASLGLAGFSHLQIQKMLRVTALGYDRKLDFLRHLTTVMLSICKFLENLKTNGVKVNK